MGAVVPRSFSFALISAPFASSTSRICTRARARRHHQRCFAVRESLVGIGAGLEQRAHRIRRCRSRARAPSCVMPVSVSALGLAFADSSFAVSFASP